MSFEYLIDPAKGPQWQSALPGKPLPYVLRRGEGEHSMLFRDLLTVLRPLLGASRRAASV